MPTTLENVYKAELDKGVIKKIPFIDIVSNLDTSMSTQDSIGTSNPTIDSLRRINIIKHNKTNELSVQIYQKGCNMSQYGRLKGNMQYVEDAWDIQIHPINFKYAYIKNSVLTYTPTNEMKIRDKYIKIRVRYDGKQYAIVNALKTFFTISYN